MNFCKQLYDVSLWSYSLVSSILDIKMSNADFPVSVSGTVKLKTMLWKPHLTFLLDFEGPAGASFLSNPSGFTSICDSWASGQISFGKVASTALRFLKMAGLFPEAEAARCEHKVPKAEGEQEGPQV